MATFSTGSSSSSSSSLRNWGSQVPCSSSIIMHKHNRVLLHMKPLHCTPITQPHLVDATIICEPCNGKGWLLCDFCKGQKTNVRAENKRLYRRCPSCRAVGFVLCASCKVYKCVTFPNFDDISE